MDKKGDSIFLLKNVIGNRKAVKTPAIIELPNIASTVSQRDVVVTYPDSSSSEVKIPGKLPLLLKVGQEYDYKKFEHKM